MYKWREGSRLKTMGKRSLALLLVIVVSMVCLLSCEIEAAAIDYDYSTAFKYSIEFFDANKCGKDAGQNNVFSWRSSCHTNDGNDVGLDLTGGFHDGGDHVKFGITQGYSASVLGWALYEYRDVFDSTGNTEKMLSTLKHFTDYFLKCNPDPNTFYYQVGEVGADQCYWGSPEIQKGNRMSLYAALPSKPASDVCGITSGALSLMYLNYKDIDGAYARRCLASAKQLYLLGKNYRGLSSSQEMYRSNSYYDDLSWAAMWLYIIEKNDSYIKDIKEYFSFNTVHNEDPYEKWGAMTWNDMYIPVIYKMALITNDTKFKNAVDYNIKMWESIRSTPAGLKLIDFWGNLRHSAIQSMLFLLYYDKTQDQKLKNNAKVQIDYILGNNPNSMSYVVGYGNNWPKCYYHRASNTQKGTAKHLLAGALVLGPDESDVFKDNIDESRYTGVSIDANSNLVAALASIERHFGNNSIKRVETTVSSKYYLSKTITTTEASLNTKMSTNINCGDLDKNGSVDSTDLAMLKRYVVGVNIQIQKESADLNIDGDVNSTDLAVFKRYLLGSIKNIPIK